MRDWIRNRSRKDFAAWLDAEWLSVLGIDITELIREGDLRIGAGAIYKLTPEELQPFEWFIRERHQASIWLLGDQASYHDVAVDT